MLDISFKFTFLDIIYHRSKLGFYVPLTDMVILGQVLRFITCDR